MDKSPDAFRTISEVADWLGTPTHVLRFWESRFSQVKPVKRAGGRRYYRPADMALLGGIKTLLHDDGLTIRGVQKILREEGVKHVATLSPQIDGEDGVTIDAAPAPVLPESVPESAPALALETDKPVTIAAQTPPKAAPESAPNSTAFVPENTETSPESPPEKHIPAFLREDFPTTADAEPTVMPDPEPEQISQQAADIQAKEIAPQGVEPEETPPPEPADAPVDSPDLSLANAQEPEIIATAAIDPDLESPTLPGIFGTDPEPATAKPDYPPTPQSVILPETAPEPTEATLAEGLLTRLTQGATADPAALSPVYDRLAALRDRMTSDNATAIH